MKRTCMLVAALAVAGSAAAQETPAFELGTRLGLTVLNAGGETSTVFSAPGAGFLSFPALYVSFFPSESMVIEPQLFLQRFGSDGNSSHAIGFAADLKFHSETVVRNSLYGLIDAAVVGGSGGDSQFGLGAGAGHRWIVRDVLGVSLEARFRRWLDGELNEITLALNLGTILPRR